MSNLTGGSIVWNLDVDSSKLSSGLKSARTEIGRQTGRIARESG